MADTNIKISLELADKAAQKALSDFLGNTDKVDKGLKKVKDSGKSTFEEITVGIGKATGLFDIFAGNLAANVAIKGFELLQSAASSLFNTFIVDGIKAAEDQQTAINDLNVSLAQSGIYTKQSSEDFQAWASELQRTTTFEDDVILKNAALIQSLGNLSEGALQPATQAALDLSAALGKDLATTSEAVGKAANGNVTALQKMGIEIQKGRTDAETFANALSAIEERFGGAAASKINTYSGAVSQATNSFGDFTKQIGALIVENPVVISTIKELGGIFNDLTDSTKEQNGGFKLLIADGLSTFLQISAFVVTMVDIVVRGFQTLYGVVQGLSLPFIALSVPIRALSVGLNQAMQEANQFGQQAAKNMAAFGEKGDGALSAVATDLLRLKEAADRGLGSLQSGATGAVEPINNTRGSLKELTEETKRAQDQLKSFATDLVKQSEDGKVASANRLEIAKAGAEKEIAFEQALLDQREIDQVEFLTAKAQTDAEFAQLQQEIELQRFSDDNARLREALDQKLISEQEYYTSRDQLAANYSVNQARREAELVKADVKNKKDLKEAQEKLSRDQVQAVGDTFSNLAVLMQTKSRELFEIGKAAAIASAIVNTYQAITKTMASVPYPFNIPLAAAQGVAGFVQVANIAATNPSFEDGGIVPGTSFSGDRVTANVNSGEMILNRSQQSRLFELANGSGGNASLESKLDILIGLFANRDDKVIVNIGGRTVVETLRSELAAGRTFA